MKKRILFITTGGTVAQSKQNGSSAYSPDKKKGGRFLIKQVSKYQEELGIKAMDYLDLFLLDSSNITPVYWDKIIEAIYDNYDDYDVFIIIHGTDTLSYTCAALSYAFESCSKPIILTGAQIPYGELGSDAEKNIENALRVGIQNDVRIKGVICVFGNKIISGTRVKKISEFAYNAFDAFGGILLGQIGTKIDYDQRKIFDHNLKYQEAYNHKQLIIHDKFSMDKVIVCNEFPGINKEILKSIIDSGIKGLIFHTYAGGNSNVASKNSKIENLREVYEYAKKKKVVMAIISQPIFGKSTMKDYSTGKMAKQLGGVPTYDMSVEALTVKLGWLIAQGYEYDEIKQKLIENIRGEIQIKKIDA